MKLLCTRENLKTAIYNTERVTGKQSNLPILNNILIETEKGRLKISATNLEIGVISYLGAKIEKEGKITIPVKILSNFINNLPESEDKVNIEADNQILNISTNGYKAKIKGLDAQDFPIIPKTQSPFSFILPAQKIKNFIPKLITCVSVNEARPELSGVCMNLTDKEIFFASTDSFRLIEVILPIEMEKQNDQYRKIVEKYPSLIVPAATLAEVFRIINPETEEIKLVIEENQLFIAIDDVWVVSRLINGKYPDYKQIIPQNNATRMVILKEDFLRGVRIASGFVSGKGGEISIASSTEKKTVFISSESQEKGENSTALKSDITGPDQKLVFNPKFIIDGLNAMDTTQVALFINNNSSPASLKMVDDKNGEIINEVDYIAMPIRNS
jgi:DNA polymerase III subunit beta